MRNLFTYDAPTRENLRVRVYSTRTNCMIHICLFSFMGHISGP